jgi:hypothetical protein
MPYLTPAQYRLQQAAKREEAMKAAGKVKCAQCGKEWHDPQYATCYSCKLSAQTKQYGERWVRSNYGF